MKGNEQALMQEKVCKLAINIIKTDKQWHKVVSLWLRLQAGWPNGHQSCGHPNWNEMGLRYWNLVPFIYTMH